MKENTARKMQQKYEARSGAPFPNEKADEVGHTLEGIRKRNKGFLTTKDVLENAENPKSKIHPYFCWDKNEAAKKWNLHQARLLINHVMVIYTHQEIKETRIKYINIRNTEEDQDQPQKRAYVDCITVGNNEFMRKQALEDALKQLIHWKSKYKYINELTSIVEEITKLESKYL